MSTEVGAWIDHRKAVMATIAGTMAEITQVTSQMEKHVRHSGRARTDAAEDQRDRRFTGQLNRYYDEVVACIREADAILILGPGEAKVGLKERLAKELPDGRIVGIETVDKMTDRPVAARVRAHFLKAGTRRENKAD